MAARKKKKVAKVVNMSGKRKTAIARATVRKGAGRVRINHKPIHIMEPELARRKALEPVQIAEAMNRLADVDVVVDVQGGGQMGQVDAIRTAIARGLVHYNGGAEGIDEELRDEYLRFDRSLLVNDPRRKEAKHQMGRGASLRSGVGHNKCEDVAEIGGAAADGDECGPVLVDQTGTKLAGDVVASEDGDHAGCGERG